jgi:predicted RNase H-like HicB family nuclease
VKTYALEVSVSRQEDGLWRAEVPALPGCFVDSASLHEALRDVQECAAMMLHLYAEAGKPLPIPQADAAGPLRATIPVAPQEYEMRRAKPSRRRVAS